MIAALYVEKNGPYYGIDGVDPWDKERDAREYNGPWSVVAHPPCERWGRYWSGGPSARVRRELGDDGGCFAAALSAVRTWGGVLEHPEGSHAWRRFGMRTPPKIGGWIRAFDGVYFAWTCCVEQGHYGHAARKATWLLVCGMCLSELPELRWGASEGRRIDEGFHSNDERAAARAAGRKPLERLSKSQRVLTPEPFRDLLLGIARLARPTEDRFRSLTEWRGVAPCGNVPTESQARFP